ncbi:hypothetical protein H8N00_18170 [Streptomyces sp. AC563]|uniref:hypothetical protein n=1 Tax=Streptomyces buecherae TaxID=2763006 RepID=UPI00164EB4BC|nr:hypothetical protein [Streptomyces buecherae]MBC3990766.1 hypothetical protein [Streptomyces buecherae]
MSLPAAITVEFDSAAGADELLAQELADLVDPHRGEEWPPASSTARRPAEAESPPAIARADSARADTFACRGVVIVRNGRELLGWGRLLQPPGESAAVVFDHTLATAARRRPPTGRHGAREDTPEPPCAVELLTLLLRHAAAQAKELGFATINWSGPDTSPVGRAADALGARVDGELGRHWTVPDLKAWTPPPGLPPALLRETPRPFPSGPHPAVEAYVRLYNTVHAQHDRRAGGVPRDLVDALPECDEAGTAAARSCPGDHAVPEPPWDAASIDAYLAHRAPQGHVLDLLGADGSLTAQLAADLIDGRALLEVAAPLDAPPTELAAGIAGLIAHLRTVSADTADLDIREIADPPLRRAAELLGARITSRWQAYALTL